jgi:GTP-dependent phosphoenolpyruvate carboxykinase
VTGAFDWERGVFLVSNVASEGTAAVENKVGEVRRVPFAMLPFCGSNMDDYFRALTEDGRQRRRQAAENFLCEFGSGRTRRASSSTKAP